MKQEIDTNAAGSASTHAPEPATAGATAPATNQGRLLPGVLLIGLGLLVLFTNLGLSIVGNLLTAFIFGGLAYYVYQRRVRTANQGLRLLAVPLAGLALVTLLPGRATGALFLALIGLAFAVVWRTDKKRWWAVIPAGAFASLAATAGLSGLPGNVAGFVFLGGLAATFYALTRLRVEPQSWAIYPAGALGVVAALALFNGGGSWLFPLVLVAAGLFLLVRSGVIEPGWLGGLARRPAAQASAGQASAAQPSAAQPATGTELATAAPTDVAQDEVAQAAVAQASAATDAGLTTATGPEQAGEPGPSNDDPDDVQGGALPG